VRGVVRKCEIRARNKHPHNIALPHRVFVLLSGIDIIKYRVEQAPYAHAIVCECENIYSKRNYRELW